MAENEIKLIGVIKEIFDTKSFGANDFKKREFLLTIGKYTEYPQDIIIAAVKDKCAKLDDFRVGDAVEVGINLRGNYWEKGDRWFNELSMWYIKAQDIVRDEPPSDLPDGDDLDSSLPF